MTVLARSYLFAPGHDEARMRKALEAGADAVVFDLEDAVPGAEKEAARRAVSRLLEGLAAAEGPAVWVRINAGAAWEEDVAAVVGPALAGIRLPKAESPEHARAVAQALGAAEEEAALPAGGVALALTVETARGVLAAAELAACPRVRHLTFGAADFAADVGAEPGEDERETLFARSMLVAASRAAGIEAPVAAVFRGLQDLEGLARSTEAARRLGFFGRSCIHPRQVPVVNAAFTPRAEEIGRCLEIIEAHEKAVTRGAGGAALADGTFVDEPVVRRARALVELARALAVDGAGVRP